MSASVRELQLDLDAFEGPFDLLLTLVLKDALEPAEVDVAAIVVAFVEHLAERERLDLDACGVPRARRSPPRAEGVGSSPRSRPSWPTSSPRRRRRSPGGWPSTGA